MEKLYCTRLQQRFISVDENGVSVVTFKNFFSGDLAGGELIYGYDLFKWWKARFTFNAWQSVISDQGLEANLDVTNWGWSANLYSTYPIREHWQIQVAARYNSRMELLQGVLLPRYGIDLAVNRSFKDKRTNINLRISDVLNTRSFEFTSSDDLAGYSYSTVRLFESRVVYLTFSYKFGNLGSGSHRNNKDDHELVDNFSTPDLE